MLFNRRAYVAEGRAHFAKNRKNVLIASFLFCVLVCAAIFANRWCTAVNGGLLAVSVLLVSCVGVLFFAFTLFIVCCCTDRLPHWSFFIDSCEHFFTGMRAMLWYVLWVVIWSCALIIPGMVKMCAYSQMFFILSEQPHTPVRRAMRMSIAMTQGYKGDIAVMFLSFLGWIVLSCLTAGIGFIWTVPYMSFCFYSCYQSLKKNAVDTHVLSADDFAGFAADDVLDVAEQSDDTEPAAGDASLNEENQECCKISDDAMCCVTEDDDNV